MIVLPIYSVKETKTNNCLSALTKHDWNHEGEELGEGGWHFIAKADTNSLCNIHTQGLTEEGTLEGQVKWAVYIILVNKTHFKCQRIWVIEEILKGEK